MVLMEVMNILEMVCIDSLAGIPGGAVVCSVVGMIVEALVDGR
jgi:hypothetical protein